MLASALIALTRFLICTRLTIPLSQVVVVMKVGSDMQSLVIVGTPQAEAITTGFLFTPHLCSSMPGGLHGCLGFCSQGPYSLSQECHKA